MLSYYPNHNAEMTSLADLHARTMTLIENEHIENKLFLERKYLHIEFMKEAYFAQLLQMLKREQSEEAWKGYLLSSFGADEIAIALNGMRNIHGQSALQIAFQQQNFAAAKWLIDNGAKLGLDEQSALEFALDSKAGRAMGYARDPANNALPIIKEFGLTLGISAMSADGTNAQFGYVPPTYNMMTDLVTGYTQSLDQNHPRKADFEKITAAFQATQSAAGYQGQMQDINALAKRVLTGDQRNEIVSIPTSCAGHVMALTVVPDTKNGGASLVFTNRGVGAKPVDYGTQIYHVNDVGLINAPFIETLMRGHDEGRSHDEIMHKIKSVTDGKPPVKLSQSIQKRDNCTIANPKSNIEGILLCLEANRQNRDITQVVQTDRTANRTDYKAFTRYIRETKIDKLEGLIKQAPTNPDVQILAKAYIRQHQHAAKPDFAKATMDNQFCERLQNALQVAQSARVQNAQQFEQPASKRIRVR